MPHHSINNLKISGFRALRNLQLNSLGRINLLVGENNSGKTSVLEALSIFCNAYEPHEWLAMVRRRDFGGLDETRVQSLRWCFLQTGQLVDPDALIESDCEIVSDNSPFLQRLLVRYRDIIGEPNAKEMERLKRHRARSLDELEMEESWRGAEITHVIQGGRPTLLGEEVVAAQFWEEDRLIRHSIRRRDSIPSETLTPYSYQINRLQVESHSQLFLKRHDVSKGKHIVLDLIREFDSRILDIEVASFRGRRPALYLIHRDLGPAPISIYGDAVRRAVLLASTLYSLQGGGVLLIDEVETGIHVSGLKRVFTWLAKVAKSLDVQVIATTHSLEAVDAVAESMGKSIDDLVTFHLDQLPEQTIAKRIPGELLLRLRHERGLDVR